ncbi:ArpU family phage packaging/lysis transcriptional regulator [Anaerobacillus isosaccharinicus]|uniref:Transcriptional regulator n=1 Tax=Anaerobacillus isosaccharinicus TaxID=1532552 RepID=A0A1S2KW05_9BACI|nr:ArpU family phage packaging/lysis transcriptional regulator [Anaerobacillus isosaccharinicus]MBA5584813.1 transcriptional regulator [Anaerobacillus isosaccharinicus]QOY36822.1 transcriptional regulator [Anaerobacillus isosaccharinicus]
MSFELPELDQKETQKEVEKYLSRYRLYKYLSFEDAEASITASYSERFHGPTNSTSDQTAQIAVSNANDQEERRAFCERVERAVRRLPPMERFLIEKRYMSEDAEYINDFTVYCHRFQPPISHVTYGNIRWKAFYKLALNLNLAEKKMNNRWFNEINFDYEKCDV